ncbi:MAG: hypothetical protein AB8B64_22155 [Granulosicoccus sp.]
MSMRVVILTASSSGGHSAAANALKTLIEKRVGKACEFTLIDVYRKSLFHRLPLLAKVRHHSDLLWRVFLKLTNHQLIARFLARLMRPSMMCSIADQLPEQCDYLIAVHFHPAHLLPQLAEKFIKPPKTAIVATDFDPHWAWFGTGANAMYVSSAAGHEKALISGYEKHQIYTLPLIPTEKIAYRKPANTPPSRLRIGIVAGQDGSNPKQILNLLGVLAMLPNAGCIDVSLFCGTNSQLKKQAESEFDHFWPLKLDVHGYTEDLRSHFHHYDLMLIRTSPGVLSECVCAGVPVVGFDWSAHERYQQSFIQMHEIGFSSKVLSELQDYLCRLFTQPQTLLDMQRNVARLRHQNDSNAMLTHLLQLEPN